MKTKEELEKRIKELTVLIEESSNGVKNLVDEQNKLTKQLENVNKPSISESIADLIHERIDYAIERYDFSDANNFSTEFEIGYDNRIELSHIGFDNYTDLVHEVAESVMEVFKIDEHEHTDSE